MRILYSCYSAVARGGDDGEGFYLRLETEIGEGFGRNYDLSLDLAAGEIGEAEP